MPTPSLHFHQCLGRGGFGEVYLATVGQDDDAGPVAVKVLQQGLDARGQAVERLRDEARLLHLLEHPNILEVHDLIGVNGRVALMTEYLPGQDVEDLLLPPDTLPMAAGLQVMARVATALQSAYTTMGPRGEPLRLLHRDIKPGNIRLGPDGSVKVLDFGIAKASGVTREAKTQATSVVGSFAYMAPERFRPREGGTPRGDVYSIAAVLFEILSAGRMLYEGYEVRELFSLAMMPAERMAVVDRQLASLSGVPADVRELLRECVLEVPDLRPDLVTLAARMDDLAFDAPGLTLTAWASTRTWPAAPSERGELSGRSLPYQSLGVQRRRRVTKHGAPTPPPVASLPLSNPSTPFNAAETLPLPPDEPREPVKLGDAKTIQLPPDEPPPAAPVLVEAPITASLPPATRRATHPILAVFLLGGVGAGVLFASILVGLVGATSYQRSVSAVPTAPGDPIPTAAEPSLPRLPERPVRPAADGTVAPTPTAPIEPSPSTRSTPGRKPAPSTTAPAPASLAAPAVPEACADLFDLGERAESGALTPAERTCLSSVMRDVRYGRIDRTMHGMVLLDDAWARCDAGSGCGDYDTSAAVFLGSVDQSDQRRVLRYARHLLRTSNNQPGRLEGAAKWAGRALEKEQTGRAHETLARARYQLYAMARTNANAEAAVAATAGWARFLRGSGADPTEAVELCRSAGGDEGTCAPT